GADVRLLKVRELAPEEAIASNEGWSRHRLETQNVPEATLADLEWADVLFFGTPTRYGLPTAQLKQFIDTTGPLWATGKLVDKIVSAFTSTATPHGGQESTILSLNNTFYHWSAIIVSPGYADPIQFKTGNPYGASFTSNNGAVPPDEDALAAARFQGRRVIQVASQFAAGRAAYQVP
ncbi:MAG TPA: NAD(P)H:quinone oxidoreductase, partial [Fimbriimonas sp.]